MSIEDPIPGHECPDLSQPQEQASKEQTQEAKRVIKKAVDESLRLLEFQKRGKVYVRAADGVMHTVRMDCGSYGPVYILEYGATMDRDEDLNALGAAEVPDISGYIKPEDYNMGGRNLLSASVPFDANERADLIRERVGSCVKVWFDGVSTVEQVERKLRESWERPNNTYMHLAKGLRKIGISP